MCLTTRRLQTLPFQQDAWCLRERVLNPLVVENGVFRSGCYGAQLICWLIVGIHNSNFYQAAKLANACACRYVLRCIWGLKEGHFRVHFLFL